MPGQIHPFIRDWPAGTYAGYTNPQAAEAIAKSLDKPFALPPQDQQPFIGEWLERAFADHGPTDFELHVQTVVDELADLLVKKHHDYGPLNISRSPGGPLNGLRVRLWDKLARINNLVDSGATPENESLRDSFLDLANYGVIALLVLDGRWPE